MNFVDKKNIFWLKTRKNCNKISRTLNNRRTRNFKLNIKFTRNYLNHAEGSCLVQFGQTHVLCAATVEERVPGFLNAQRWISDEHPKVAAATYDLTSHAVFSSPQYRAIGYDNASVWTTATTLNP